jgi:hypothetical protein
MNYIHRMLNMLFKKIKYMIAEELETMDAFYRQYA